MLGRLGSLLGSVVRKCGRGRTPAVGFLADVGKRHSVGWLWIGKIASIDLIARLDRLDTGLRATAWDHLPNETTVVVFAAVE